MLDLRVEGADEFARLSRQLRELGDKELRRDLYKGIQRATKPLKEKAKDAARRDLPSSGGLNEFVAKSKFSTKTRGGGKEPGVRISVVKAGHDIRRIDKGVLRHPVFGNMNVWVSQPVKPGWFTHTLAEESDPVRRELLEVFDDVARRLSRG